MAEEKSPIIKETKEELNEILSEKVLKEIEEYEFTASLERASYGGWVERETRKKMKDEVRNEVKEETRKENTKEIALKLLKQGLDINLISNATNLSIDEIKKLQKSIKDIEQ